MAHAWLPRAPIRRPVGRVHDSLFNRARRLTDSVSDRRLGSVPGAKSTAMTTALLLIICTAFAGGLLVIHGIGRSKRTSELMLVEYRKLLEEVRRQKSKAADQAKPEAKSSPTVV